MLEQTSYLGRRVAQLAAESDDGCNSFIQETQITYYDAQTRKAPCHQPAYLPFPPK